MTNFLKYEQFKQSLNEFFASFKQLVKAEQKYVFFESGRGGRYSIAAYTPQATIYEQQNETVIEWLDGRIEKQQGDPLANVEKIVDAWRFPKQKGLPPFQGGALGFISYDYTRRIEHLASISEDDLHVPDVYFYLFDRWAVHDRVTNTVTMMQLATCQTDLNEWVQQWQQAKAINLFTDERAQAVSSEHVVDVSFAKVDFEQAVEKIKAYIAAGDVFQVNLSVRQQQPYTANPLTMYEAVRAFNPSPYMAYIAAPDFAVVSSSPELLVKKEDDAISTRPIAGTRPRGANDLEDQQLADELIHHEKERAEHVMLVDLERNDLGKVAQYGSVHVDEFMVIEKYSHVMHIVSNVRGKVAPQYSNTDVIRAMFPGGTITGAPKIRTMEIIEELEPVRRGIYTGSIGWLGYTGDLEMNIVIRTAFVKDEVAYIQAGAGIVIDSIPEKEYEESLNKAKAMWQAKMMAEGQEQ